MFKKVGISVLFLFCIAVLNACKKDDEIVAPIAQTPLSSDVATKWADMTLVIAQKTPGNTPTYASRGFGYIGLTMYESIVMGSKVNKSMSGQLSGLSGLPIADTTKTYNWYLSLNAGQAYIIKNIYEQTSDANKTTIDSLEKVILVEYSKTETQEVIDRSVKYGQDVAKAIFEWSKTDGGYQGYKNNFTASFPVPTGAGYWVPAILSQSASQLPLHPYWGKNRTFVSADSILPIPKPLTYSSDPKSQYYAQFLEVYAKNKSLTQEEKETAYWWGDDPSTTFTPPGHSYSLANITVKTAKPDLFKASQTYAMVGMSIADAFINCWKAKYKYMVERPSSFVRRNIDASWVQFWPEPPFPAFYSGHAVQSGATATVLTALYGNDFAFTDNSHPNNGNKDPLTGVTYKSRSFNSFWEAAEQSAYSRFLGGIHTRQDNDTGLTEGRKVGQNVVMLKWKK